MGIGGFLLIYWRGRDWERERAPLYWVISQKPTVSKQEPQAEFNSSILSIVGKDPITWAISCYLPGCILEVQIIQHGGMNLNYYSKCVLQETWIFTWGYSLECLMKPCINVTDAYKHELLGFVPTIVIQQESRPLPCSENAAEWLSLSYTLYLVPWKIHLFLWISMVLY